MPWLRENGYILDSDLRMIFTDDDFSVVDHGSRFFEWLDERGKMVDADVLIEKGVLMLDVVQAGESGFTTPVDLP